MRAVDSYYKLKGKITDKIDHTTSGEKITGFNYTGKQMETQKTITPTIKPLPKQHLAWVKLLDKLTKYILFGGRW